MRNWGKMPEIHLKINGLYYFYIEKLLRSNLLLNVCSHLKSFPHFAFDFHSYSSPYVDFRREKKPKSLNKWFIYALLFICY